MDATVSSYITDLSNGEANPASTEMGQFYEDALSYIHARKPILVETTTIAHASGNLPYPANVIDLLLAFYNNAQLGELSEREANWLDPKWRTNTGNQPYNFVAESFGVRSIQLVPTPVGAGSATVIASYIPAGNIPVYLQMPVALLMLYEEYRRESNHQNVSLADACKMLADFLLGIVVM